MSYLIIRQKAEGAAEKLGKGLRYLGQAMSCIDDMQRELEEKEYSERVGMRTHRYGLRETDDDDEDMLREIRRRKRHGLRHHLMDDPDMVAERRSVYRDVLY